MKAGVEHKVPLSDEAIQIINFMLKCYSKLTKETHIYCEPEYGEAKPWEVIPCM